MLGNYRAAFRAPGSAAFSAAAFVMRLPISIYPLALILLISTRTHHYSFAGALGAAYVFGNAVGNPFAGRLVDRYGQGRVLRPATAAHAGAVAVLVVLAREHAPDWTLLLPAIAMGVCYLPVGSLVRARWSFVWDGRSGADELETAYSFESTVDELIYIVGPLLATVIATQVDPVLALILAGVLVATGALLLAPLRATQPPAHPAGAPRRQSALRLRGMVVMCAAAFAMGAIFSSAEVAIVAFCGRHGEQALTGAVLASLSLGSAVAGLWYGGRSWKRSLLERYRNQALLFGILPAVFLIATNVGELAICAFVVGLAVAPTLITLLGLVSSRVPSAALTEGLAWVLTGLNLGYGLGAALVGRVSDSWGIRAAFGVTIGSAVAFALLSQWLYAVLRHTATDPAAVGT